MRDKLSNPAAVSALARGDMENFIAAATPGGIERQEAAGQAALVASTDMPKEMHPSREAFAKLGFTFGEPIDELFLRATLPQGWARKATDHAMHSVILDEKGRERVSIFYKAAFYDRRADAHLVNRFQVQTIYADLPGGELLAKDHVAIGIFDSGKEVFRTLSIPRNDWNSQDEQRKKASAWLKEKFPSCDDPTANWD